MRGSTLCLHLPRPPPPEIKIDVSARGLGSYLGNRQACNIEVGGWGGLRCQIIVGGEVLPNYFRHQYYKKGVSLNFHVLGSDLAGLVVQGVWSAYANKRIKLVEPPELQV